MCLFSMGIISIIISLDWYSNVFLKITEAKPNLPDALFKKGVTFLQYGLFEKKYPNKILFPDKSTLKFPWICYDTLFGVNRLKCRRE